MSFDTLKKQNLSKLSNICDQDKSPKGSLDEPIKDLISFINTHCDYVTTSSCSGRIAVFAETVGKQQESSNVTSKGAGKWLLSSHAKIELKDVEAALEAFLTEDQADSASCVDAVLKFEPFIMHILCRDLESADSLLKVALSCGFRESGIVLGKKQKHSKERKVMCHIRTSATGLEVPIAHGAEWRMGSDSLGIMVARANSRFQQNIVKTSKLEQKVHTFFQANQKAPSGGHFPTQSPSLEKEEKATGSSRVKVVGHLLKRWGHCLVEIGDAIYVFGGFGERGTHDSGKKVQRHGEVLSAPKAVLFEDGVINWQVASQSSALPSPLPREHATAIRWGDYMVIFGGRSNPATPFSDLWIFDTSKGNWTELDVQGGLKPCGRWGHSLTPLTTDQQSVVALAYGGRNGEEVLRDTWELKLHRTSDQCFTAEWIVLNTASGSPPPLFFHSAELLQAQVLLFGGVKDISGTILSDETWVFDQHARVWYCPSQSASSPGGIFGHSCAQVSPSMMLVSGGFKQTRDNLTWKCYLSSDSKLSEVTWIPWSDTESENKYADTMVHHATVKIGNSILTIGGGIYCSAFGPLFCPTFHYCVESLTSSNHSFNSMSLVEGQLPEELINEKRSPVNSQPVARQQLNPVVPNPSKLCPFNCILAPAQHTKTLKSLLEQMDWMDKSKNITRVPAQCTTAAEVKLGIPLTAKAIEVISQTNGLQSLLPDTASISPFLELFLFDFPPSKVARADKLSTLKSKLQDVIQRNSLPSALIDQFPTKFEIIGDVLMIAEESGSGSTKDGFCDWPSEVMSNEVYPVLMETFIVTRIASKAIIATGPKRKSQVLLLWPHYSSKALTLQGPDSPSWVTVRENGIKFSFDLAKVMFCSGNNTERIRYGSLGKAGEVCLDLYCGIGYYTLPWLVHSQVSMVHACEWNPDSVTALRHNLKQNEVEDRCRVYEGNNQQTACGLVDLADRISLGLLPSSEAGWHLAAKALKPEGGFIHVHGNVLDSMVEAWTNKVVSSFRGLLEQAGKAHLHQVHCTHVQKVKKYAPHVYHLVADLHISS